MQCRDRVAVVKIKGQRKYFITTCCPTRLLKQQQNPDCLGLVYTQLGVRESVKYFLYWRNDNFPLLKE